MTNQGRGERRKRILFVTPWYPSARDPVKGTFVREYARAVSLSNDVVVAAFSGWSASNRGSYRITPSVDDGIRVYRFAVKPTAVPLIGTCQSYVSIWTVFGILKKKGWLPDVIHVHVYSFAPPAIMLKKTNRIPVVVSEHSTVFMRGGLPLKERLKARWSLNSADIVLPVSEGLARRLRAYGISKRQEVVPNTVDTDVFVENAVVRKAPSAMKRILVVGLLHDQKGYPVLFDALAALRARRRDFVVDVIGDGARRDAYKAKVRCLRLSTVVRFRGLQPRRLVHRYMARCDFFVLPSLVETFGVVFIEALACGRPVIASDIDGPREIVTETNGVLVPPGHPEKLAAAIERMLDTYWLYNTKEISRQAREKYGYASVGRRLDRIYTELLEQRRR